jgi:glycosyltransferase involved in cell wall biosynthesis
MYETLADSAAVPLVSERAAGSRVRVAYCVNMMEVGGTEMNAVRTAERLDPARFEIVVATLAREGPLFERYRDAGIRVVQFPISSLYNGSALTQGRRMYRFLRREKIDVLHCHDLYSNVFAAPWGRLARVPVVITSRRWIHPVGDGRLELANRIAYRVSHRVLGNSGSVARLLQEGDSVPPGKILHLPNFVDDRAFQAPTPRAGSALRAEFNIPAGAVVVGCIARLAAIKDHATLLRAIALLMWRWPDLHLMLVGDGDQRLELQLMAQELGIAARTHFAGYRPNLPNLHHQFDISVLSSLSEGFPNSVVEAMAAGRPVVATDVGGTSDAVRRGTGMLVRPADPPQLAETIERLLADAELRARMGREARHVARSEYHADAVIPQLEGAYLSLLKSRRTRRTTS